MRKPVIDPKSETLSTYLKIDNGQLKIPFSQRPYEWERAEVERLFDDLTSLFLSEEIHNRSAGRFEGSFLAQYHLIDH